MISFAVIVLLGVGVLIAVVAGLAGWLRPKPRSGFEVERHATVPWEAERIFVYALSLAGLVAALYGIASMVALVIASAALHGSALESGSDVRERASYYLAALIVGAPLWLGLWSYAQRRAGRSSMERQSRERRLYLAAIFAIAAVVALFALHTVLRILLTLPGASDASSMKRDGIFAGARLLAWGTVWFVYTRLKWRERGPRDDDEPHDFAVYVVAGFSLAFLVIGLDQALRQTIDNFLASGQSTLLGMQGGSFWRTWGGITAWLLAGGLVWAAIWQYDLMRGGERFFRVLYLYLVLAVAVPAALASGIDVLYEVLRRIFGYSDPDGTWNFLRDVLPPLLIGGGVWAYHWIILRRQAAFRREHTGTIPWPRRPILAVLTLVGLAVAATALTSLFWLALDFLLNTGTALSGGDWWRDRTSMGIAAGAIGGMTWLGPWSLLQRAAATNPAQERTSQARRRLLGIAVLAGALIAVGFTVALLWLIFRTLLGGTLDTSTVSRALKDLSAVVIALTLAAYHLVILRRDRQVRPVQARRVRVLALVALGGEETLAELDRLDGPRVEVVGYLSSAGPQPTADLATLNDQLVALGAQDHTDGALLILGPDGGSLYPYRRSSPAPAVPLPQEETQAPFHQPPSSLEGEGVGG